MYLVPSYRRLEFRRVLFRSRMGTSIAIVSNGTEQNHKTKSKVKTIWHVRLQQTKPKQYRWHDTVYLRLQLKDIFRFFFIIGSSGERLNFPWLSQQLLPFKLPIAHWRVAIHVVQSLAKISSNKVSLPAGYSILSHLIVNLSGGAESSRPPWVMH